MDINEKMKLILNEHVIKLVAELQELDPNIVIIVHQIRGNDDVLYNLGYGCAACLREALIEFIERTENEQHLDNHDIIH